MSTSTLPNNPRPKRGGEDIARTQHTHEPDSKKARFDTRNPSALAPSADDELDEEEENYLEADELTRRGNKVKRNAVNIDGFDSDSSNDAFDARAADKARKANSKRNTDSKASEDADMFADVDQQADGRGLEEVGTEKSGKRKKDVRFADLNKVDDLEEVEHSKSGGHVSADLVKKDDDDMKDDEEEVSETSEESDVADEVRAQVGRDVDEELGAGAKKRHAPKLDAFNLNQERQEGGFDESLNYVRATKDPDAVLDNWMDGVSKKDIKKAREAHERREKEDRRRRRDRDEMLVSDLLADLIIKLHRAETPLDALARLGPGKKDKKSKWSTKMKNKKAGMDVDEAPEKSKEEVEREKTVEVITEAADALMQKGETDVYSTDREMLKRHYKRETGEDLVEPPRNDDEEAVEEENGSENKMWEFRWADARDGGDSHGPYDSATMKAWSDAAYFGSGVEFRAVGSEEWTTELNI